MLPETLTESQENIPDLTDEQLWNLGFDSNHVWKLNAQMLGYNSTENLEDFIEEKTCNKIKTFVKGKQMSIFCFDSEEYPNVLDMFPLAIEGDIIISQKFEFTNGEWKELDLFRPKLRDNKNVLCCSLLPFNLTGRFIVIYCKLLDTTNTPPSLQSYDYQKSCENINKSLKEMDRRNKEMQLIKSNSFTKNEPRFRITKHNNRTK